MSGAWTSRASNERFAFSCVRGSGCSRRHGRRVVSIRNMDALRRLAGARRLQQHGSAARGCAHRGRYCVTMDMVQQLQHWHGSSCVRRCTRYDVNQSKVGTESCHTSASCVPARQCARSTRDHHQRSNTWDVHSSYRGGTAARRIYNNKHAHTNCVGVFQTIPPTTAHGTSDKH